MIRMILNEDFLRIEDYDNSISSLSDKIFFINILGFDNAEDFNGYELKNNSEIISVINEVVKYLDSKKLTLDPDEAIKGIIKKNKKFESGLHEAITNGTKIKINRPSKIILPNNFKRELKNYQIPAVALHASIKNSANFSVPGSGKTTMALAGYSILKSEGTVEKLIVISPRSAFQPWEDEYFGCYQKHPKSIRISGNKVTRKRLYNNLDSSDMVLLTYQMAYQDSPELIKVLHQYKVFLILDESHNIKRIEGGKWADTILGLAPLAESRMILTGTPVPNSLEDLWTQISFLWSSPQLLGTSQHYKAILEGDGDQVTKTIKDKLYPFYYRIHKRELNLKTPKFHRIPVTMNPYQQAIYDALAVKVLSELVKVPEDRIKLRQWRRSRLIRLLQVASNPALLTKSSIEFKMPPIDATGLSIDSLIHKYSELEFPPKLKAIVELTQELLESNKKVLIWSTFIHNIATLNHLLKKYKPRIIYGDIPKDSAENEEINREKMIYEFKNLSKYNLLIANPAACSESISLHKVCHHAIYLDRSFNCAHYMQSLDRIHRIGLDPKTQVHYYFFQSKNSIDEIIDDRLLEKHKKMLELLEDDFAVLDLESSENEFTEISEEEKDFASVINQLKKIYDR
jgi:SNF2 family DNA or RNA helicase